MTDSVQNIVDYVLIACDTCSLFAKVTRTGASIRVLVKIKSHSLL